MSNKSSKKSTSKKKNNRVFHKPTYGSGLSGSIGKVVKVIGLVIIIFGACVVLAAYNNESSLDVIDSPADSTTSTTQIN